MNDLTGQVFGRLTVLAYTGRDDRRADRWLCRCDCGTEKDIAGGNLRSGGTVSCGCRNREVAAGKGHRSARHGMWATAEYRAYQAAQQRCDNPENPGYRNYGGRGIRFLFPDFETFIAEIGPRPPANGARSRYSVDRIDNDGDYAPGNVRWATLSQQAQNRRRRG